MVEEKKEDIPAFGKACPFQVYDKTGRTPLYCSLPPNKLVYCNVPNCPFMQISRSLQETKTLINEQLSTLNMNLEELCSKLDKL